MTRRSCVHDDGLREQAPGRAVQRRAVRADSGAHSTASALLALQATAGNRAVTQLLDRHGVSGAPLAIQRFVPGADAARRADETALAKEIDNHNAKLRKTTVANGAGARRKQRETFEKGLKAVAKKVPQPAAVGALNEIDGYVKAGGPAEAVLMQVASDAGAAGLDWYHATFVRAATTEFARDLGAKDASTVFRSTTPATLLIEAAAKENTSLVAEWLAPVAQWASVYKSAYDLNAGDATAKQVKVNNISHHYRQLVDRMVATPRNSFSPAFLAACKALFTEANAKGGLGDAVQHVGNAVTLRMVNPYIVTELVANAADGSGAKSIMMVFSKLIQKQASPNKNFAEPAMQPFTGVLQEKTMPFSGMVLALGMV